MTLRSLTIPVTCPGCGGDLDDEHFAMPHARSRTCTAVCDDCRKPWVIEIAIRPARRTQPSDPIHRGHR